LFQSAPLALALILLGGAVARAQTAPAREPRRRSVTLTGAPLEARIAVGVRTLLVFGVPIRGKAAEVDRARIHVVDTGEFSIIIEPLSEPQAGERWTLRIPLADEKAPEVAEIALVSHSSEVDTELDVARRGPPDTVCQAACAPCAGMSLTDALMSGLIGKHGVQTTPVRGFINAASGFELNAGVAYRAASRVLVDLEVIPPPSYPAWRPSGAALTSKTGEARVRAVKAGSSNNAGAVRVLVETDAPPQSAGLEFILYLHGAEGAPSLSLSPVRLPPSQENKP
jgi:uncharacterized protein (TIGR02268 family)